MPSAPLGETPTTVPVGKTPTTSNISGRGASAAIKQRSERRSHSAVRLSPERAAEMFAEIRLKRRTGSRLAGMLAQGRPFDPCRDLARVAQGTATRRINAAPIPYFFATSNGSGRRRFSEVFRNCPACPRREPAVIAVVMKRRKIAAVRRGTGRQRWRTGLSEGWGVAGPRRSSLGEGKLLAQSVMRVSSTHIHQVAGRRSEGVHSRTESRQGTAGSRIQKGKPRSCTDRGFTSQFLSTHYPSSYCPRAGRAWGVATTPSPDGRAGRRSPAGAVPPLGRPCSGIARPVVVSSHGSVVAANRRS